MGRKFRRLCRRRLLLLRDNKLFKGGDKIKIYKSITLPIKTSQKNIDYFFECNRETGRVWNECIKLTKVLLDKGEYANRKFLQDNIKGNFSSTLYAKCMQVTCIKYMSSIKGIMVARRNGRTDMNYTWKYKKYYNTIWDVSCLKIDYENNRIGLPKPSIVIDGKKKNQKPIYLKFKYPLPQNIKQVEVLYKDGLKLAINYCIEEECMQVESDNICAVDLGEIHSIASIDNNSNPLIITGREIRSIQRFRNKELGKLQRKLSYCTKNSRNYKKYRKAIRKLTSKSDAKMDYCINKTAKLFMEYVFENDIKTVVVGDLKNFNMNLSSSYSTQQKVCQWIHGQMVRRIKYNLERYNIEVIEISEAYTSQTCPSCQSKYKPTNRNYICKSCGYENHRDIVGAINILSKYINDGEIKDLGLDITQIKYLRI